MISAMPEAEPVIYSIPVNPIVPYSPITTKENRSVDIALDVKK